MISRKLEEWYRNINGFSRGHLDILKEAFKTFSDARAAQAAASLAYYAIFSLFPLLLVIISGGSYFLSSQQIYQEITQIVQNALPISTVLINENLRQALDARGTVGIASLLTLLWSASSVFTNLAYNINLAWSSASRRNYFEKRLVGLGMIGGLSGLLLLSLALDWAMSLLPFLNIESTSSSPLNLWRLFSNLVSWATLFLLFLVLYRWVPNTKVHWQASLWGALSASVAWKIATGGFSWYLRSGLGRYQLIYGSLGAIVAMLFLIFIVSWITLFGAHFCAAIDRWQQKKASEHRG